MNLDTNASNASVLYLCVIFICLLFLHPNIHRFAPPAATTIARPA